MFGKKISKSQFSELLTFYKFQPTSRFDSGLCVLSSIEMFHIRGGGVVPKPKTRPRDVFDLDLESVLNQKS